MNTLPYHSIEEHALADEYSTDSVEAEPRHYQTWSYEETVAKIEVITQQIESGDLPLAEVLNQFAEAVEYLNQCEAFLNDKKQQVDLLIEVLSDESE